MEERGPARDGRAPIWSLGGIEVGACGVGVLRAIQVLRAQVGSPSVNHPAAFRCSPCARERSNDLQIPSWMSA
jgi:hypothetical protein